MGGEKGSVLFSLGYRDQDGIIGGDLDKSFFKRYNARMNASMDVNEHFTVGANMNFTQIDRSFVSTGSNGSNKSERFYGNTYAKITLLNDFVFKTDLAANFNSDRSYGSLRR